MKLKQNAQRSSKSPTISSGPGGNKPKSLSTVSGVGKTVNLAPKKLTKTNKSNIQKHISNSQAGIGPSGIEDTLSDIVSTVTQVAKTGAEVLEMNPMALVDIPQSIMKVVDTSKGIIRDLTNGDAKPNKEQVVIPKTEVVRKKDEVVIDNLKKVLPVINTHSIPTTFATEVSVPPMVTRERDYNGKRGLNITGANAGLVINFGTTTALFNSFVSRVTPVDNSGSIFGSRIAAIASNFQKWRLNSLTIQYVPTMPTSYNGNIFMNILEGTEMTIATSVSHLSQRENFSMCTCYYGTTLKMNGSPTWYFTSNATANDPIKFYTGWNVQLYASGNTSSIISGGVLS